MTLIVSGSKELGSDDDKKSDKAIYFDKGLGIDRAGQQTLRDQFLQVRSEPA